jgi:hypothetical protein
MASKIEITAKDRFNIDWVVPVKIDCKWGSSWYECS